MTMSPRTDWCWDWPSRRGGAGQFAASLGFFEARDQMWLDRFADLRDSSREVVFPNTAEFMLG